MLKKTDKTISPGLYYSIPRKEPRDIHDKGELKRCALFAEEEVQQIDDSAGVMEQFVMDMRRLDGVKNAYGKFKAQLAALNTINHSRMEELDSSLCFYIIQLRRFLNYWEKDIKDDVNSGRYGQEYLDLFKRVTAYEFDHNDDYVLAYVLRNYIEHFDTVLQHAYIDGTQNQLYVYRDELLKFKISAPQREVIERQDEEIALEKVVDNSFAAMERIQQVLMEYRITDELRSAGLALSEYYTKIMEAGFPVDGWIILDEVTPLEGGKVNVAYRPIPWERYLEIYEFAEKCKGEE